MKIKPVAITLENPDNSITVLKRVDTIPEAEMYLDKDPSIDKVLLEQGNYGIDAPEHMLS